MESLARSYSGPLGGETSKWRTFFNASLGARWRGRIRDLEHQMHSLVIVREEATVPEKNKCARPSCNCEATGESNYCSQYCADAGDTLEIACNCGHAVCGMAALGRPH